MRSGGATFSLIVATGLLFVAIVGGPHAAVPVEERYQSAPRWWTPGIARIFGRRTTFDNDAGKLGLVLTGAPVDTTRHPFFTAQGPTGRACVTCHQPADGMSLSLTSIRARWQAKGASDPLFAAVDGANCPTLPQAERASHSLLLDHGLFRIPRPWPGTDENGRPLTPEFTIEVVSDPTGCNLDPVYGLKSAHPTISLFRRPRMAANLRYSIDSRHDLLVGLFSVKTGMPKARDPDTAGERSNMNLMFDGRHLNLRQQAMGAAIDHMQRQEPLTKAEIAEILDFETRIYAAQRFAPGAGNLDDAAAPKGLGPLRVSTARASEAGDRVNTPTFQRFDEWKGPGAAAFKASVARGADLFMTKTFWQRDIWGLTNGGSGNPMRRSCSTCHNSQMSGLDNAPGWFDIGMSNWPHSGRIDYLPLFKVTCRADVVQHPYLGRVIYTSDPGRALVSGKCVDVGALTIHQSRALASRAPYFSNGSAQTLGEILDFYERRFAFKYTAQERQDLINFMSVL